LLGSWPQARTGHFDRRAKLIGFEHFCSDIKTVNLSQLKTLWVNFPRSLIPSCDLHIPKTSHFKDNNDSLKLGAPLLLEKGPPNSRVVVQGLV
jgi:hypothetical protein